MLKPKDIYVGKIIIYCIDEGWISIVTETDENGFHFVCHDGDECYAYYEYDMRNFISLEEK